jgi:hypothetical protein
VRTSSETNVSAQTVLRMVSLETTSPGREARHTKTPITFGSTRTVVPLREIPFRFGCTSQGPTRKPPSTAPPEVSPKSHNYNPVKDYWF